MWEQYRKFFIPTQIFILAMCGSLWYFGHAPIPAILLLLAVMEIGAVLGAAWGARLKSKINRGQDRLPLDR